jgi:PD-(D/E)XK nuclease superfamily protein
MEPLTNQPLYDGKGREVWDASKLQAYLDCEELGHLQYEEHLTGKTPSEAIAFGSGMHKAAEVWTARQVPTMALNQLCSPEHAVELAEAAFIEVWENELPKEQRDMLELGLNRRSVTNFKRLFAGYRKKFPLEMYDEVVSVEQSFTLPLGTTPEGREVWWNGITDRIVRWQGGLYYVDIKTSTFALDAAFFDKWKLSTQMLGYTWAGQQLVNEPFAGVMVQGIQVQAPLKTKVKAADELVQGEVIAYTQDQIESWKLNVLVKIDDIWRARQRNYYVKNLSTRCSSYGNCSMAMLCNAGDQEQAEYRKEQYYVKRVWNPLDKGAKVIE